MKIFKSFKCAIKGIIYTLKNERHMRFHTVACVFVFILSLFFNFNAEKYILLSLTVAMVMAAEMINSSLENIIDIFVKDYDVNAKIAKDIAAGSVLVVAGFSVIIAIILFHDINSYINILNFLVLNPTFLFLMTVLATISVVYIVYGPAEIKNHIVNMCRFFKKK